MGLHREVRENLHRLADLDPRQVRIVESYAWWIFFKHCIRALPLPIKHALLTDLALFWLLSLLPPASQLPAIMLPLVLAAGFCIGLIAAMFLPQRGERRVT